MGGDSPRITQMNTDGFVPTEANEGREAAFPFFFTGGNGGNRESQNSVTSVSSCKNQRSNSATAIRVIRVIRGSPSPILRVPRVSVVANPFFSLFPSPWF